MAKQIILMPQLTNALNVSILPISDGLERFPRKGKESSGQIVVI